MNYYDTLEVSSKASPAVIKAAYKSLVQRYHPDKNNNDIKSAQRTTELVQAYAVLSDEARRASYDQQIQAQAALSETSLHPATHLPRRTAGSARRQPKAQTHTQTQTHAYWVVWGLILAAILVSLWFWFRPAPSLGVAQRLAVPANGAALRTDPLSNSDQANPALASQRLVMVELAVNLNDTDKLPVGAVRLLRIPLISLGITNPNSKKLLWYLDDHKAQLRQMMEYKLASALTAELTSDASSKYLQELIWQTVSEMATSQSAELADQAYNIEVDLPRAFVLVQVAKN
jgi:curved DNA-binding protein CbpA